MFGSAIYVFSVTPWTHIFQQKNVLEIHYHSPHCQIHLLYAQSNERPVESLFYSQALRSSFYPSLSRLSRVLYTHGPFAFNRPICATQCNNAHVGKCHNRNHCSYGKIGELLRTQLVMCVPSCCWPWHHIYCSVPLLS
jgi:hypothetical protein